MLAYVDRPEQRDTLGVLDLTSRKVQTLVRADDQRSYFAGVTWAPDAKAIYYSKHTNSRAISMIDHFR